MANTKKLQDNELRDLLSEMETDLEKAYDLEKYRLVKAFPPGEEEKSLTPESSDSSEADPTASPEMSDTAVAPPADASAAPGGMPGEMPAGAPPMDGSAPMDPAAAAGDATPLTPEALQAEYSQLAPEELDMHIKAALSAKEALAASAAPGMDAGMTSPDGSAGPAGMPPPAMKAELKVDKKAVGGSMVPVKKSEDARDNEISELKGLLKSQAEDIEILTKSVQMVMETPVRKALTSISDLPRFEAPKTFNRADVQNLLKDNAHRLNKSERQVALDVLAGNQPVSKLEAVLEKITSK
jgi:hypothetical protein